MNRSTHILWHLKKTRSCSSCKYKNKCTSSKSGRTLQRSEKNISADTENVSDSIPAIRIKTKEGVSFEVFSNVSTEVLKYLIEVVIHAE